MTEQYCRLSFFCSLSLALTLTSGCATPPPSASIRHSGAGSGYSSGSASAPAATFRSASGFKTRRAVKASSRIYITSVKDPEVRSEIHDEINSLNTLEKARLKLRAEYKKEPLLGPVTVAHLEQILVAEFDANRLQAQYLANNEKNNMATARIETVVNRISTGHRSNSSQGPQVNDETLLRTQIASTSGQPILLGSVTAADRPVNVPAATISGFQPASQPASQAGVFKERPENRFTKVGAAVPSAAIQTGPAGVAPELALDQVSIAAADTRGEPGLIRDSPRLGIKGLREAPTAVLKKLNSLEYSSLEFSSASETPLIFDIPMTYNARVSFWIRYFQNEGRSSFKSWLERSSRYIPVIQYELTRAGLPQDLVYVAMIESGFSPGASSHASAIGLWQFIEPTGRRYGLKIDWWLDERRDFMKSTHAAINYMGDLYRQFNSWYLVAASYNMGENGVRRLIQRHKTNNFWELADRNALPNETTNYVPKIIAATLIAKAPALYGFRDLNYQMPVAFEYFNAPGGTDISNLAQYLGVSEKYLKDLNPELIKGFVPRGITGHRIRIPKGAMLTVSQYVKLQAGEDVAF